MNFSDQKFKVIPNNKIEINTYVDGKGPLIIFAHGWPESWYSWRYQITYFVDNQEEYKTIQSSGYIEYIENESLVKGLQGKYVQHKFMKFLEEEIRSKAKVLADFDPKIFEKWTDRESEFVAPMPIFANLGV